MAVDYSIIGERIKNARKACNMTEQKWLRHAGTNLS